MVIIRKAREEEFKEVGALLSASYRQYGPAPGDPPELVEKWAEYHRNIPDVRARAHDSELIVADVDGRLLGTVTFYPPSDGPVGEGWEPGWASLRLLGVHPDARGLKLGRLLTQWCLDQARERGATNVGLHTTPLMDVAKAMYERMGFERFPSNDFTVAADFVVIAYSLAL